MTNAQTQFQKHKDICDFWTAVAMTDNFQTVVTYARAVIMENGGLSPDMLAGVNLLATTLVSMCETQEPLPSVISTGLVHDLTPQRNTTPPTKKSSKKKD